MVWDSLECLLQHIPDLCHVRVEGQIIANDFPIIQIYDGGQIELSPFQMKLRNICNQLLKRLVGSKVTI